MAFFRFPHPLAVDKLLKMAEDDFKRTIIRFHSKALERFLLIAVYLLVYLAAVGIREFRLLDLNPGPFGMESATHYLRSLDCEKTGRLGSVDRKWDYPFGHPLIHDTVIQECFWAAAHRLPLLRDFPPLPFARLMVHLVACLAIFPLGIMVSALTGRPWLSLGSVALVFLSSPVVIRTLGITLYREHLAYPVLALHLAILAWGSSKGKAWAGLFSGIFLGLAMIIWKVIPLYFLALMISMAIGTLLHRRSGFLLQIIAWQTAGLGFTTLIIPSYLQIEGFSTSTAMLIAYGLTLAGILNRRQAPSKVLVVGSVACSLAVGWALAPPVPGYSHAWGTLWAKIRFLGVKPSDPTLIPFHARHYWTGYYRSPNLHQLIRDFWLLGPVGILGLWTRRKGKTPSLPSFWIPLVLFFAGFYLLFYKMSVLFLITALPFLAVSLSRFRKKGILMVLLLLTLATAQSRGLLPIDKWLASIGIKPSASVLYTATFDRESLEGLIVWAESETRPENGFWAPLGLAPHLVAINRPVVQNLFFEKSLDRFAESITIMFRDEKTLFQYCLKNKIDYLVYEADILLRDDPHLSFRYTAGVGQPDPEWVSYSLHFQPQRLRYFSLVYQNNFFRVFTPGKIKDPPADPSPPLFDERLYETYLTAGGSPSGFYYRTMAALLRGDI